MLSPFMKGQALQARDHLALLLFEARFASAENS